MMFRKLRKWLLRFDSKFSLEKSNEVPRSGWVEVDRLGFRWRLNMDTYLGSTLVEKGIFEPDTTRLILDIVKPGMCVLDVGANIGYYSLLLARAVGPTGQVWAFEPVARYRDQLVWHLEQNNLASRVHVVPFGLSDKKTTAAIYLGDSSATLHWASDDRPRQQEQIKLKRLDDVKDGLGFDRIDFIKVDLDGHEPKFLRGASKLLRHYLPPIVLEFSQLNLYVSGSNVGEQATLLTEFGYVICCEKTRQPYSSEIEFLQNCGNFDRSCNVLALCKREVPLI